MPTATAIRSTPARMLRNIRFQAVAQAYSAGVNFLLPLLVARLGVHNIPVYGAGFVLWILFRMASDWGLDTLCVRDVAQKPERLGVYQVAQLRIRLMAAGLCFGIMAVIGLLLYDPAREAPVIACFGMAMLLETLALGYRWTFRATQRMGQDAVLQVIERSATLALVALAVFGFGSVLAVAAALAAAQAVNLLAAMARARPLIEATQAAADADLVRYMWRWGPTFIGMAASFQLYQRVDFLILERWPSVARTEVGLYFLAFTVYKGMQMLPELVMQSIFPALAELHHADVAKLRATVRAAFRYLTLLTLPAAVAVVLGHRLVARLLLVLAPNAHAHVHELSLLMSVLVLTAPLYVITSITGHILAATGHQVKLSLLYVLALAANVLANVLVAIPHYGALGCAVTTVLTEVVLQTSLCLVQPHGLVRLLLPRSLAITAIATVLTLTVLRLR